MIPKELLKQRPNVDDFPLQPYGYIAALTSYIEKLEQLDLTAVSQRSELYFAFMEEYNALIGESEHQILKEEVVVLLAKYCD